MSERISLLTELIGGDVDELWATARSVLSQSHSDWQWKLVTTESPGAAFADPISRLAERDDRIQIMDCASQADPAAAFNAALVEVDGEFIIRLGLGDRLARRALESVAELGGRRRDVELIYADEVIEDRAGNELRRDKKSIWAPERLLGQHYLTGLVAIRRSVLDRVGGLRSGFGGASQYDFVLRLGEVARAVSSIPEPLYRTRVRAEHGEDAVDEPGYRRAVESALQRRGLTGEVVEVGNGLRRVHRATSWRPTVSIIIPTAAKRASIWGFDMAMVVNLLHSIASVSTYPNVELIVVADDPLCDAVSSQITAVAPETTIIGYDQDFNFSEKCNLGAAQSRGEVLIFLNDDMEVISADWIETLVGFLQEPDVGAVGPLLLDEQRRVQSAGHTAGPRLFGRGAARSCVDLEVDLMLTREVCGITGAAIAMRAAVYAEIGGFATELPRSFNDVDLCYRLLASGKRVLWTPNAALFHFESKSRDPTAHTDELAEIDRRWAEELRYDPYLRMDLSEFNHRSAIWLHGAD